MRLLFVLLVFPLLLFAKEYRVGVLFWSESIPGQVAMKKGLESQIEELNKEALKSDKPLVVPYFFIAGDGNRGIERQIEQFYKLIDMDVDIIIVQPTDGAALIDPLLVANKKGIPVIAYDQYIKAGKLHSFITSDNFQAGYLNGEYISWYFKKDVINIVLVDYPHVSSTVHRVEGFLQALEDYGQNYNIIKNYKAVEPVGGKKVAKKILSELDASEVDAVFCVNDGGGYVIAKELLDAEFDAVVTTVDGQPESVDIIRESGNIKIDSAQFCGEMGRVAMSEAYAILEGKKSDSMIIIPTFPITKDSLKEYNGWLGKPPISYKKTWYSNTPIWRYELRVE
ncbi:MAG: sugar ABC transporter substrate-binding protein [Campylobacterales bacterium]